MSVSSPPWDLGWTMSTLALSGWRRSPYLGAVRQMARGVLCVAAHALASAARWRSLGGGLASHSAAVQIGVEQRYRSRSRTASLRRNHGRPVWWLGGMSGYPEVR